MTLRDDLHHRGGCNCGMYRGQPRRLYIREGPRGKQRFVAYGIVCKWCGTVRLTQPTDKAIWEAEYEKKLETRKQQAKQEPKVELQPRLRLRPKKKESNKK